MTLLLSGCDLSALLDVPSCVTPVGLPWQDLALAWAAYRQARAAGAGREFDFLA